MLARLLARLVLIASIAPVIVFAPSIVRAPVKLWHELALRTPVGACAERAPRDLALTRLAGPRVRLSWRAPVRAGALPPAGYRVLRSGRTVGQTSGSSMVVAVVPGRATIFTVQARYASAPVACPATLRRVLALRAPGRVRRVRVLSSTAAGVTIGWAAAPRTEAPIAGYRVWQDGAVAGQTRARRFTLKLNRARAHTLRVAAVDTRGDVGAASATLTLAALHGAAAGGAPSPPTDVSASEVGARGASIFWLASSDATAAIVGYRVYRNGALVGQTSGTSMRLTDLASAHSYSIAVSALDADKRESARSAPLALTTTHTPPTPPAQLSASSVGDTSATLSWSEGSSEDGTVAGYMLIEDGATVGFVHGTTATVTLASEREYTFTVRTEDSAGYLSAPSPELKVVTTHTPPSAPTGLTASDVASQSALVSWSPSTAVSGQIVGYRVFRDGTPVGQTSAAEMTLSSLAPSSEYTVTVVAVDSLGAISAPSEALTIHTAPPTPTHGSVQGYVLSSTDESFEDLEAHYQQIGVVYPTYYECGSAGTIYGQNTPLITEWANAREIAVMPRFNCQTPAYEDQILNEPSVRESTIDRLAEACREDGYAGVQIDFEGAAPSEREPFTAFITALAEKLHAQGDKLSTVVTAKTYNVMTGRAAMYNDAALAGPSDYVFVLDWGLHWTTSTPGSIDELHWFKQVAEYAATMPERQKFVLGMPLYGIDWPNGGGSENPGTALEYADILALENEFSITPEWEATAESPHFSYESEGVHHEVWYVDRQSLEARAAVATTLGLKIGLWRLGTEDQSIWELPALGGEG